MKTPKSITLRLKFEELYSEIVNRYHEMSEKQYEGLPFNEQFYDETIRKEASYKRLFWSIIKAQSKEWSNPNQEENYDQICNDFLHSLQWKLRHADYVDFFGAYKEYIGIVPSFYR